jgi:hypothetical protein
MIRTAIISITASFLLFGVWTINLVSYHPATDLTRWLRSARQLIGSRRVRATLIAAAAH